MSHFETKVNISLRQTDKYYDTQNEVMVMDSVMNKTPSIGSLTKAALALLLLAGSVGCSVQGEITDMTKRTLVPRLGQQTGIISGAIQNEVKNGYKVSSSVGHWTSGVVEEINGYKVYSTVQGNLAAETMVEVLAE